MKLFHHPAVCAVEETYQIMILESEAALLSIKVGEKEYFCHSGGIRISSPGVHRFSVPMPALDAEGSYTVTRQKMIERTPSYPKTGEKEEVSYTFFPVTKTDNIEILHIADVHGAAEKAISAAGKCGDFDVLILNADISSNSNTFENKTLLYKIASTLCRDEKPVIVSRGNHEMRGVGAETFTDIVPNAGGNPYYTFRLGCLWGMLIDAGEDKEDDRPEYGGTICCGVFRDEEEAWMESVFKEKAYENDALGKARKNSLFF